MTSKGRFPGVGEVTPCPIQGLEGVRLVTPPHEHEKATSPPAACLAGGHPVIAFECFHWWDFNRCFSQSPCCIFVMSWSCLWTLFLSLLGAPGPGPMTPQL